MKKIFITFCFTQLLKLVAYSQVDLIENHFLLNDSIRYDIMHISPSVYNLDKKPVIGRYVIIKMNKIDRDMLLAKDSSFWVGHLTANESDWATNLVLYYIFKREATLLSFINNTRVKWLPTKDEEIKYWEKYLSNRQNHLNQ